MPDTTEPIRVTVTMPADTAIALVDIMNAAVAWERKARKAEPGMEAATTALVAAVRKYNVLVERKAAK